MIVYEDCSSCEGLKSGYYIQIVTDISSPSKWCSSKYNYIKISKTLFESDIKHVEFFYQLSRTHDNSRAIKMWQCLKILESDTETFYLRVNTTVLVITKNT